MAIFYPRKQTLIIFAVCLSLVLATAYYVKGQQGPSDTAQQMAVSAQETPLAAAAEAEQLQAIDWKKQFDDSVAASPSPKAAVPEKNLTQTDRFGRDLFTRFVQLQQANLLGNQDIVDQTAEDLVTSNLSSGSAKEYALSDLQISPAADISSLNDFGAAVARVLATYTITKNESAIIQEYLANKDPSVLKGIDPIISTYKRLIASLLQIRTPQSVSAQELALVNAFSAFKYAAENLRVTDRDTVRGLDGVRAHGEAAASMIDALSNLQSTLESSGAKFDFDQSILNVLLK